MKRLNILVVDDDRFHADSLAELFEIDGHYTVAAYDAETAIALFREREIDLTFLDIRLPGMNGLECCTEIRRVRPDARVVMMTGYRIEDVLAEVAGAKSTVALRTPYQPDDLLNGIDRVGPGGVIFIDRKASGSAEAVYGQLAAAGREARIVHSPDQALVGETAAASSIPVLDFRLPFTDALGICLRMRKQRCDTPIVLIAEARDGLDDNMVFPESRSRTGFLFKPFSLLRVLQLVAGISEMGGGVRVGTT